MNPIKFSIIASLFVVSLSSARADLIGNEEDLFDLAVEDTYGKTTKEIHSENLEAYRKFVAADVDTDKDWDRPKYLSPANASHIYDEASENEVVSLYKYSKYDPKNSGIGFCFGRAMFVHLELRHHGFDRDLIKKAFVVGSMETPDGAKWGWHVTTIAQSLNAEGKEIWVAIDPIAGVMEVSKWYGEMRKSYSKDKKLKLYITQAGRFGPMGTVYEQSQLEHTFYNNYFTDMDKWFDLESRTTAHYKKPFVEYSVNK